MVAVEVAEMETTIQYLRDQVRELEITNRALEAENAMYEARCSTAEASSMDELVRSTQMKQMMTDMSSLLLAGLRKMEEEVTADRRSRAEKEARRREQEKALEVGSDDKPLFLDKNEPAPVTAPSASEAEALGEPQPQTSSLDLIPGVDYPSDPETDIERLAQLGEPDKGPTFR